MTAPAAGGDALAFLDRLAALDPVAPVRVRPAPAAGDGPGVVLWAPLPWRVLVARSVPLALPELTLAVAELAGVLAGAPVPAGGGDPARWRWAVPSGTGRVVEWLPESVLWQVGRAAAQTVRAVAAGGVGGRAVGTRAVRDALLDHVPVVVEHAGGRTPVGQRLVQAVLRMGFLGPPPVPDVPDDRSKVAGDRAGVAVRVLPGWVGLAGRYGSAWQRTGTDLTLRPAQ